MDVDQRVGVGHPRRDRSDSGIADQARLVVRIGNGQFGYGHYQITDAGVAEAAKLPQTPF